MKPSSAAGVPGIVALVWFGGFVIALAIPFLLLFNSSVETSTLLPAVDQISTLYAPHLGAVLAFYFALRHKGGRRSKLKSAPFLAAIAVSILWNAVVAGALLLVPIGQMRIEDALSFAGGAGPKLSWLVAPALGYFFAKPGDVA
jgi:hypothetical protein